MVLASSSYISEVNINDYSTDFDEYELKEYFEKPFLDNNYDCRHSFDSFNYIEPEFSADFILTIDNIAYNINIMNGVEVILLFISRDYEQDLKFSGVTTRIHNLLANIFNEFNGKIFVNEESRLYSNNDIFTLSPVINDSGDAYTCIPVRGENDNYEYNFTFNMNNYENITSAYKFLLIEFYEELSKFYYLNKCSLEMDANWAVIQSDIYKLLMDDSYESRKWYSLPVSPRRVRTLLTDIILFENIVFTEKDFMEKSHSKSNDELHDFKFFNDRISNKIKNTNAYPTHSFKEILINYNSQVSKVIELSTLFFAAISGGVVASFITVFFT